jgi:hypothetical protein
MIAHSGSATGGADGGRPALQRISHPNVQFRRTGAAKHPWIGQTVPERNFIGIVSEEIVPNRATQGAKDAKGAMSEITESVTCVFSMPPKVRLPPLPPINCFTMIGLWLKP